MEPENKNVSRKNFLSWGIGLTSLLAIPAFFRSAKKKDLKAVKMLTQDGKLVEINVRNIPAKKGKIKGNGIFSWINKKTSSL
jgi:hypothetical protein